MKKKIFYFTITILILHIVFAIINTIINNSIFLSLTITFGTFLFHFIMRYIVGYLTPHCYKYNQKYFAEKPFEKNLYKIIKVKQWKKYIPSYNAESYSVDRNAKLEDVANTTCRNEVIHTIIAILSFIPLLFTIWFGAFWVFLITSIIASLVDTIFVIMQRFNRPRLVRIINRTTENASYK